MNKKIFVLIICAFLCFTFTGCDDKTNTTNINESLKPEEIEKVSLDKIDVDLTTLSSTMVYSEVYNMLTEPNKYIGQVVKMNGQYVQYSNQDNSLFYPAILIADATACCTQGIEFVLEGNPGNDAYPEIDSEATVVGVFNTYYEDGLLYCHLEKAKLI